MNDYTLSPIYASDKTGNLKVDKLLADEHIRRDHHLDYTCGLFDENMNLVATGSCFGNTLRCLAVSNEHQGEALMNQIVSHLTEVQFNRGNLHFFVYTKPSTAAFFRDLGFYEIASIPDLLVFMENRRNGFTDYLSRLRQESSTADAVSAAAIVMNANPFTLGHRYLIETAAKAHDLVHLFLVSEDASLIPFKVRKELVLAGTADLSNLIYHDSGPYIVSSATFPAYFQKDAEAVARSQALLDLTIFTRIASELHITHRYVGDEPTSQVTNTYNEIMRTLLPEKGIACHILSRLTISSSSGELDRPISASTVRKALQEDDWDTITNMVPPSTLAFLRSPAAADIIARIKAAGDVIHH